MYRTLLSCGVLWRARIMKTVTFSKLIRHRAPHKHASVIWAAVTLSGELSGAQDSERTPDKDRVQRLDHARPWIVLGNGERKLACLFFASNSFLHPKFVDLGLGHFRGFSTSGVGTPNVTDGHYSTWDPAKNGFCSGGIDPHLGEIWEFEFFRIDI